MGKGLCAHFPHRGASLWECPWFWADNLAFTVCPEISAHANDVVQSCVGSLVEQKGAKSAYGVDDESGFNGAV